MVQRYRGGIVPNDAAARDTPLESAARETVAAYTRAMDAQALQRPPRSSSSWPRARTAMSRRRRRGKLAKAQRDAELDQVLASLVRTVARLAVLSAPFIPLKAETIWSALGAPARCAPCGSRTSRSLRHGQRVSNPPPLFPKPVPA